MHVSQRPALFYVERPLTEAVVRVQVSKIEAGCMALEQAAIGMPGDPVPADLQGAPACLAQHCTTPDARALPKQSAVFSATVHIGSFKVGCTL